MYEKFYALPEEKQQNIINAGLEVFAKNEYKQASTDLIAAKAGISKGALFYYFKNKKEFYFFLYAYIAKVLTKQIVDSEFQNITDFFDLLSLSARRKCEILKKNPYLTEFSMRAFYSQKEDVSDKLNEMNRSYEQRLFQQYFSNIDFFKFRDEIDDPFQVYKMLRWMADGFLHDLQMSGGKLELDALLVEFEEWISMLRKLTYKKEYQ